MNNGVVAVIPFYNDFKALQRLLMKLSSMGMPSILCDGRFHNFKRINNSDSSTDGSRFLVTGFKNTALIECRLCHIEEKLNALFDEAVKQGYSYAMLLGCDEYPIGDYNLFIQNLEYFPKTTPAIFRIPFSGHSLIEGKRYHFVERIFYKPDFIRSRKYPHDFFSTDKNHGNKSLKSFPTCVFGITIHHDKNIRDKERNNLMSEYQKIMK